MRFNENTGFTYQEETLVKRFLEEYEASMFHETAVGNPVAITDVSPIEHTLDIEVKSNNLIKTPYVDSSKVDKGITWVLNDDMTITANGTATASSYFQTTGRIKLDKKSFLSGCPSGGGAGRYEFQFWGGPGSTTLSDFGKGQIIPAGAICEQTYIVIRQGTTVNNLVFKPMLNYGNKALPYEPYTEDMSGTKVKVPGKNLYSRDSLGPVKANDAGVIRTGFILPPAVYTASTDTLKEGLYIKKSVNGKLDESPHDIGLNKTITFDGKNSDYVVIYSASASEFDKYKNLQIELGDTKTAYEPYQKSIYTVSDDNKVYGVESKSPNMVINADLGLLEVTYLADINKWLHKLREQLGE